ncbi:MAG TPA: restriction endonuclease subunit S [Candidatus Acetothermia bacterium]|nr:restriction endonuclease subunit S [Candidatus Acetothermia bacterium]
MGSEWPTVKFGEVLLNGARNGIYKKKELHGSGIKIVNMGELFAYPRLRSVPMKRVEVTAKELERASLQPGDLLFARRSLVAEGAGKCSIVLEVDEPTTFESSIIRCRPDPRKAHSLYLYYFFNSPQGRYLLGTIRRQVAVAGITGRDLVQLEIPLPPLAQQRAIAHILGTLDDKIELLRRMNETLEAMARALFKSWFVDFDPVIDNALEAGNPIPDELKGKAKRRLALGERRKPLPEHIRRLFPDRFVDSELGPIPDGWKIRSLDEIAEYLNGVAWQKYRAKEGEPSLPVIKIRELREGITSASDRASMHVPEEYIVEDGDVLFSWSGSLLVKIWCGGKGVLNQHLFKVSSKHYPKWFYYLWTSEHLGRFQRIAADKATTMGHIKRSHLSESYVLVPNSTLLGKMTAIIEPLIENQIANEIACRTLANIRDTLLPKLISGEIGVSDAEKFVKEAL